MPVLRIALFLAAAGFAGASAAETYKCLDKTGRVTYSNSTCDRLGLRLASLVPERVSVIGMNGHAGAPQGSASAARIALSLAQPAPAPAPPPR